MTAEKHSDTITEEFILQRRDALKSLQGDGTKYRAASGERFNTDEPVHRFVDVVRHAQLIQQARDAGDFAEADRQRQRTVSTGLRVRQDKDFTEVEER